MKKFFEGELYHLLLVMAFVSLVVAVWPDSGYWRLLVWIRPLVFIPEARFSAMLTQLTPYAVITALTAFALWWLIRKLAPQIRTHFNFKSKLIAVLLQLHFLIFVPTLAYWFYYAYYWVTVSDAEWEEESRIVPWHNNWRQAIEQLREQIPESDSVLLILERRGTVSYGPFFNYYLYPRKVFIYRSELERERITRADVNLDEVRKAGVRWVLTYSGPREFDADQLRLERIK